MLLKKRRRGFTLIELLVVIAIIGVLMALTAAAVMRFTGVGLSRATNANLNKVNAKLLEQNKGVTDAAYKDSLSGSDPVLQGYVKAAGGTGANLADPAVRRNYVQ